MKYYKTFKTAVCLICIALLSGCQDKNTITKEYTNVNAEVWNWDDPKSFKFDVLDGNHTYNQYIHLRLTDNYPKSNIYIKSYTIQGMDTVKKLHNLLLFSAEGKSLGKRGSKFMSYRIPIVKNQKLKINTPYSITLEQHTRVFELKGVNAVGFEVEKGDPVF
jgi:gliding motility-associated lipoprotein GldH